MAITLNETILGSIPTRGNKLFSFPGSDNNTKQGVVFHHSTSDVSYSEWKTEKENFNTRFSLSRQWMWKKTMELEKTKLYI